LQGFVGPTMLVSLKTAKFLRVSGRHEKLKTLRQLSAVTVLSLTLVVSVMAGQIDTWGVVAPPPPTNSTTQTTSTTTAIVLMVLSLIYR